MTRIDEDTRSVYSQTGASAGEGDCVCWGTHQRTWTYNTHARDMGFEFVGWWARAVMRSCERCEPYVWECSEQHMSPLDPG
jgi:hypothetical protein